MKYERAFQYQQVRFCRPLTDEELGYKIYINQNMTPVSVDLSHIPAISWYRSERDITGEEILLAKVRAGMLSINDIDILVQRDFSAPPAGYYELPRGYLRGLFVQFMIESDPNKNFSVADIVDIAQRNIYLWVGTQYGIDATQLIQTKAIQTKARALTSSIEVDKEEGVKVYPTSVIDKVNIDSSSSLLSAQVYDSKGKLCINIQNVDGSIDMTNLSSGVYVLKITTEQVTETYRLVKK